MADFELDHAGIAEILKSSGVRAVVSAAASSIASAVRSSEPEADDVVVDNYTTDRAAASVTVRDVRAKGWQAKNGLLTRAAASAGLEVRSR